MKRRNHWHRFIRLHLIYAAGASTIVILIIALGYQLMAFAVHLRGLR